MHWVDFEHNAFCLDSHLYQGKINAANKCYAYVRFKLHPAPPPPERHLKGPADPPLRAYVLNGRPLSVSLVA
jgi:hypothetical protein